MKKKKTGYIILDGKIVEIERTGFFDEKSGYGLGIIYEVIKHKKKVNTSDIYDTKEQAEITLKIKKT